MCKLAAIECMLIAVLVDLATKPMGIVAMQHVAMQQMYRHNARQLYRHNAAAGMINHACSCLLLISTISDICTN
jgi:hypothetical protein